MDPNWTGLLYIIDEDANEYILLGKEVEIKDICNQMCPTLPCLFCSTKAQIQDLFSLFCVSL